MKRALSVVCFLLLAASVTTASSSYSLSPVSHDVEQDVEQDASTNAQPTDRSHTISGRVIDRHGSGVAGAAVIVCDDATGIPVASATSKPFTDGPDGISLDGFVWDQTDANGAFSIDGLAPGAYRLIAQSWSDRDELEAIDDVHGLIVTLRGVADNVRAPSDAATNIEIKPLGEGVLVWDRGAGNDDWFIVVSTAAPRGDPVLGFLGWEGAFLENAIGFNRMPYGQTVFHGLPEGGVFYTVFASDSRPGFGAGSGRIIGGHQMVLVANGDVVAGWSDARHDPPERLREVTQAVRTLLESGQDDAMWEAVAGPNAPMPNADASPSAIIKKYGPLDRAITLPDDTETTLGDLFAAWGYIEMQDMLARERGGR